MSADLPPSRLLAADVARLGAVGLRSRPLRAALSALGIAIGIAAMIGVLGVSASSQARLNAELDTLGTNLLTIQPGEKFNGDTAILPPEAVPMLDRVADVELVSGLAVLSGVQVYRSSLTLPGDTNALKVAATDLDLLEATGAELASGRWLDAATAEYPGVVLGSTAARRLGIVEPGGLVWIRDSYFQVLGILEPAPLAPDLDATALIGKPIAATMFGFDGSPTQIFVRAAPSAIDGICPTLATAAQPEAPSEVAISRPSDALQAQLAANRAFSGLLVGLGSIGLLVGGIGVANTMVISVLERRREIGLRRALGATRGHIRSQFLTEALLLSGLGGLAGALLGSVATLVFALANGWPPVIPLPVLAGGILVTVLTGVIAGLYPALRAARTPPTAALAS